MNKKDKKRVDLDSRPYPSPIAKNYDYGEPGLGTGLYRGPMDRFKSVTDFLDKSRKSRRKKRKKLLAFVLIEGGKNAESAAANDAKMQRYAEEPQGYKEADLDLALKYFKEASEKHG
jgi:hypothetical protein